MTRALRWIAPGRVEFREESALPAVDGDIRVRTLFGGICATDRELISGELGIGKVGVVPGHEIVGEIVESSDRGPASGTLVVVETVVACGSCRGCKVDGPASCHHPEEIGFDRDGGWADFVRAPATHCHLLPVGVTARDGVLIEPLVCPYAAVRKLGDLTGRRACVIGSGFAALAFVQCLRLFGATEVSAVVSPPERFATFAARGAGLLATPDEARAWAGSVDLVIDSVGSEVSFHQALELVRRSGHVLVYGLAAGHVDAFPLRELVIRDLTITGHCDSSGVWTEVLAHLAAGRLRIDGIVDRVLRPQDVPDFLAANEKVWKAVIDFTQS